MSNPIKLIMIAIILIPITNIFINTTTANYELPPYTSKHLLKEPVVFGDGVISTGDMDLNAAFTPDGKSVYFTKRSPSDFWIILVSHFKQGKWNLPQVADFSGQYSDFDPFITPDGSKLFFCSMRPAVEGGEPKKDYDIWFVEKHGNGWSKPKSLGDIINSSGQDYYPTVTSEGTLYYSSARGGGKSRMDIYRSRFVNGKYTEPDNLGDAINSEFNDSDPYIAPDESYIIFVSYGRPDGLGDGDLYISQKKNGVWTKAVNLGKKINSKSLDFCPIVSPDGKYLFFTSERGGLSAEQFQRPPFTYDKFLKNIRGSRNGLGDVYQVDKSTLN